MCFEIANKFKFKIRNHQQKPEIREIKLKDVVKNAFKFMKFN